MFIAWSVVNLGLSYLINLATREIDYRVVIYVTGFIGGTMLFRLVAAMISSCCVYNSCRKKC